MYYMKFIVFHISSFMSCYKNHTSEYCLRFINTNIVSGLVNFKMSRGICTMFILHFDEICPSVNCSTSLLPRIMAKFMCTLGKKIPPGNATYAPTPDDIEG